MDTNLKLPLLSSINANKRVNYIPKCSNLKLNKICITIAVISGLALTTGYTFSFCAYRLKQFRSLTSRVNNINLYIQWYSSLLPLGMFFSSPISGWAAEIISRKISIILSIVPALIAWILSICSTEILENIKQLMLSQFLLGFATGLLIVSMYVYISEISPIRYRGIYFYIWYIWFLMGVAISYCSYLLLNFSWLCVLGLSLHAAAVAAITILPHSPRYLFLKGRRTEALSSLEWFRGYSLAIEDEYLELERVLSDRLIMKCKHFSLPSIYKPLLLVIIVNILTQLCGILVLYIYGIYIVDVIVGATYDKSRVLYSFLPIIAHMALCLVGAYLSTRVGRRFLLGTSALLTFITCIVVGLFIYFTYDIANIKTRLILYIMTSTLYNMAYTFGLGPLIPLVITETLPLRIRAHATGVSYSLGFLVTFVLARIFINMDNAISLHGIFWLFSAGGAFLTVFIIAFLPDFKHQSLEQIESYFLRDFDPEADNLDHGTQGTQFYSSSEFEESN